MPSQIVTYAIFSDRNNLILPMNKSSFCRLVRPLVSSSIGGRKDALHGGIFKRYLTYDYGFLPQHPFSLIRPWMNIEPLCETTSISRPTSYKILAPGMILLKNYVSHKDQVGIVNICQKWVTSPGGFNMPSYQDRATIRHHMCFGRKWDSEKRYQSPYGSDGSEQPPLPYELTSLAQTAIQDAQAHLDELRSLCPDQDAQDHLDELPSMCPDTCSVSFFHLHGLLGFHQDLEESSDALQRGLPVVSISIGEPAEFLYGHTTDKNKLKKVVLESGDVLIFGGKSRLIYHAVRHVYSCRAPLPLLSATALRHGYLNLTLKQF